MKPLLNQIKSFINEGDIFFKCRSNHCKDEGLFDNNLIKQSWIVSGLEKTYYDVIKYIDGLNSQGENIKKEDVLPDLIELTFKIGDLNRSFNIENSRSAKHNYISYFAKCYMQFWINEHLPNHRSGVSTPSYFYRSKELSDKIKNTGMSKLLDVNESYKEGENNLLDAICESSTPLSIQNEPLFLVLDEEKISEEVVRVFVIAPVIIFNAIMGLDSRDYFLLSAFKGLPHDEAKEFFKSNMIPLLRREIKNLSQKGFEVNENYLNHYIVRTKKETSTFNPIDALSKFKRLHSWPKEGIEVIESILSTLSNKAEL